MFDFGIASVFTNLTSEKCFSSAHAKKNNADFLYQNVIFVIKAMKIFTLPFDEHFVNHTTASYSLRQIPYFIGVPYGAIFLGHLTHDG